MVLYISVDALMLFRLLWQSEKYELSSSCICAYKSISSIFDVTAPADKYASPSFQSQYFPRSPLLSEICVEVKHNSFCAKSFNKLVYSVSYTDSRTRDRKVGKECRSRW